MFCIINITMNILLQDKTWRCRYKCLNWHEIRHNTQSLWFFNIIFTSHHINFYGILPSHPCHCWLLCHQIETRDSPTNAATHSTLSISASDCKVRYLILLFFLQQTISYFKSYVPPTITISGSIWRCSYLNLMEAIESMVPHYSKKIILYDFPQYIELKLGLPIHTIVQH